MRAAVHERYGAPDVIHLADIDPPQVGDTDVLVRVHAAALNRTDCGFRSGTPWLVRLFLLRRRHTVLGNEFAGVVEAVGTGVTQFAVGDEVFGVDQQRFGTHAELASVGESSPIAPKPHGLTFVEAAGISDGAILALTGLRWAKVGAGTRLMIYGASGSIGTAAVQLAKHLGARVTAVTDTRHVELVRSLGADEVIDYTTTDHLAGPAEFDVFYDAVGKSRFMQCRRVLRRGGTFITTDFGPFVQVVPLAMLTKLTCRLGTRRVALPLPSYRKAEVELLRQLVESGEYQPVIDRTYPLEQIVEATRYVETGQKTGNVVVAIV